MLILTLVEQISYFEAYTLYKCITVIFVRLFLWIGSENEI